MDMNQPQFQFQVGMSLDCYNLVMEGLAQLPLYRSKALFEALEAEYKKQEAAFEAAQKVQRKARTKRA